MLRFLLLFCVLAHTATTSFAQVGIGTTTPSAFFNVAVGKDVLFGEDLSGAGSKLIWFSSKSAFRVGKVDGSQWNLAQVGDYSFATGNNSIASGLNAFAAGSGTTAAGTASTALGTVTTANGMHSMAIGLGAQSSGDYSFSMGFYSKSSGSNAIAMGDQNTASGNYSVALGGNTKASGSYAVAMNFLTNASGTNSIALGSSSTASAFNAVAIGNQLEASGQNSTAMGTLVSTNNKSGSFIIGDINASPYQNLASNQMMMRFSGGYMLYSSETPTQTSAVGVQLAPNGNAWTTISDSTRKENFRIIDGEGFLKKIGQMRLGSWNYRGQDIKQYRHYGPMAQDFFAAFGHDGLGTIGEDKSINQADFDGVNLIAIQALVKKVEKLEAENSTLKQQLHQETASLHSELDSIKRLISSQASLPPNTTK